MIASPVTRRGRNSSGRMFDTVPDLFATRGFFETSIHDIQHEAGIGSIYHHFRSKGQIAEALYDIVPDTT